MNILHVLFAKTMIFMSSPIETVAGFMNHAEKKIQTEKKAQGVLEYTLVFLIFSIGLIPVFFKIREKLAKKGENEMRNGINNTFCVTSPCNN